jgi:hypothetical protein
MLFLYKFLLVKIRYKTIINIFREKTDTTFIDVKEFKVTIFIEKYNVEIGHYLGSSRNRATQKHF